jgi:hypothetical protein
VPPDCSGFTCGCWSTVSSSRRHLHTAFRQSLVDLRCASCVCLPLLGFQIITPPSSLLMRSTPGSQTVTRLRALGRAMPMTPRVPSSSFLTTSTAYSRFKLAGLLHPASDHGVRPVSRDFFPRPAPRCQPSAFQLSDCTVSLANPVPAGLAHCLLSVPVLSDATTLRSFSRPRSRLLGHLRCSHFDEVRTTAPACRDVPVSRCTSSSALPLFLRLASVPRPVSWLLLGRAPHSQQKLTTRHSQTDFPTFSVS